MRIGTLGAGSTITVNTEELNISDYAQVSGSLPELSGGANTIQYSDSGTVRNITVKITYKPRYL